MEKEENNANKNKKSGDSAKSQKWHSFASEDTGDLSRLRYFGKLIKNSPKNSSKSGV
jgi:hypothetical protein